MKHGGIPTIFALLKALELMSATKNLAFQVIQRHLLNHMLWSSPFSLHTLHYQNSAPVSKAVRRLESQVFCCASNGLGRTFANC